MTGCPRTYHLPGSAGSPVQPDLSWLDSELVVTEKMDGGSLTFTRDAVHAGSWDAGTHPWDRPAKALWAMTAHRVPDDWRVCGASMWARRSIAYTDLPGVFLVFGIWDETDTLLGWDDTVDWAERLELPVVPVLYRGASLSEARAAWARRCDPATSAGFMVRTAGRIAAVDVPYRLLAWVRPGHTSVTPGEDFAVNEFA
jgi:RNA ligase